MRKNLVQWLWLKLGHAFNAELQRLKLLGHCQFCLEVYKCVRVVGFKLLVAMICSLFFYLLIIEYNQLIEMSNLKEEEQKPIIPVKIKLTMFLSLWKKGSFRSYRLFAIKTFILNFQLRSVRKIKKLANQNQNLKILFQNDNSTKGLFNNSYNN